MLIVADDYGLGEGHDRVMRDLLLAGAIDAVSVLVETCTPASASALLKAEAALPRSPRRIGLHLNLTFAPPGAPARPGRGRRLGQGLLGLGRSEAREAVAAQRARFAALFGRAPDFYDGHEHCHAFPGVTPAVLDAARADGRPVRSMVPLERPRGVKAQVLAALGRGVASAARRRGVATNARFGGVLPLDDPGAAIAELGRALEVASGAPAGPDGIWFMVHPGDAADPVQVPGHAARLRADEAALLAARAGRAAAAQSAVGSPGT